ncbi:Com family DNA-binding transcriptional regulator [Burkholderia multivorans]|nr:Com family DNA-binding transcriptional regulator [Burkholderia multivorans]PRD78972.1 Com family DNA-binding transcriptional regulator [Burkholderia multivorans]PRE85691.1 Com family DNA-binding transcriptional regulator [Burkholderia multivorans]PRF39916.1 Com family DNA-binding transcriptional regulator [Burkholderia multivorans]
MPDGQSKRVPHTGHPLRYIRLTIKCPRCRAMNVLRAERRLPAGRRVSATRGSLHATTHFR